MKALTLLGTTRVMAVHGGATCGAGVEFGEKRGHVANRRGCRRWEGCGGTNYGRGCIGDHNDDGCVVVERVRDANNQEWMIGLVGGENGNRGFWHLKSQRLSVLMTNVGNDSGRRGKM